MNKAWSFFWLVVAICIAFTILMSLIEPYVGVIVLLFCLGVVSFVGYKVYAHVNSRRSHY